MTAPACGSCTAPVADARICSGCTRDLAELLLQAASIAPDLDDAVAKLLKRGSGGKRGDENPLPLDLAASEVARGLRAALFGCVCMIVLPWPAGKPCAPEDAPAHTVASMAPWLSIRLGRLRQHRDAPRMLADIRSHLDRALAVIDRPAERAPAGTCDGCGAQLLAELGADEVRCNCGALTIALQDKRRERAAAADVLGSAAAISDALKAIGIIVPRGTITSWASRQRLLPRPGGSYALSDVLALHAQSQARVRG